MADGGREGHSLFAYYFLKALKENPREIIDLENLFYNRVWGPVAEIGNQRPYAGRLRTMMDENGQFVLITSSARDRDWDHLVDKNFAAISMEHYLRPAPGTNYDPVEPWTGTWDIKIQQPPGGRIRDGYVFALRQNATKVTSSKDSYCGFDATAEGSNLEGVMKCNLRYKFSFSMSPDNQSFSGEFKSFNSGVGTEAKIWGKRKE